MPSAVRREHSSETEKLKIALRQREQNPNNGFASSYPSSPRHRCIDPHAPRNGIAYIPARMEPASVTSRRVYQQSPMWLLIKDTAVLFTMLPYFPNIFLPAKTASDSDELFMSFSGAKSVLLQSLLFLIEFVLLLAALPTALLLPGFGVVIIAVAALSIIWLLTLPLQGQDICASKSDDDAAAQTTSPKHRGEKWFFINGCATNHDGLQKNVDLLSKTFGREVTGIHNRSFGLIGDLIECLIQRCFAYKTHAVRLAYTSIKPLIADPLVSKIVLIGHSQGGIIISLVLDQLFAELPPEGMHKLEVYTFGSAASHFPNPALSLGPSEPPSPDARVHFDGPSSPANPQRIIPYIEHYANEYDMIPRWGVLHNAHDIQSSLYAGSVFVRLGASGHMFNQHYLRNMFPVSDPDPEAPEKAFLDRPATVSSEVVKASPINRLAEYFGILRADSWVRFGDGQVMHSMRQRILTGSGSISPVTPTAFGQGQSAMVFTRTKSGLVVGEKANGKTVRELSRLWKYLGGASPDDE